jgi:hypothetical protein
MLHANAAAKYYHGTKRDARESIGIIKKPKTGVDYKSNL